MQKLEYVIREQYGNSNQASKSTGTDSGQIRRWVSYGCLVDSNGAIWKNQGNLYKNRELVK